MICKFLLRSFKIMVVVFLTMFLLHTAVYGATTQTTTRGFIEPDARGQKGFTRYVQDVWTATAANENGCVDTRGYAYCTVKYDVSGTINVDLDWNLQSTYDASFVAEEVADLTADGLRNTLVDGMFFCFDVDSCTTCTLSLTVYCVGYGQNY